MENKKTFGAYVLQRRRELGMTQKELAEKLYVTESAVSKWERGLSYPDITILQNLCVILQVTEHELLTGSEDTSRRVSEKLAQKYRKLTRNYRITQYVIYGMILLGCGIGNLASSHTLDWFFIAAAGVLMAASLTLVPALAALDPRFENYKLPLAFGSFTFFLEILLLICCIYSGGTWFWIAGTAVFFGFALVFLPFLLPFLPLPPAMANRKTSVYLLTVTGLLILLLLASCLSAGETWFPVAAISVIFGLSLFIMPVLLYQLPLSQWMGERKISMSYDLMVFEKTKAPRTKKEFMEWYEKQTEWGEDHDYQTIGVSSPALQSWFMEMKETFPPMNGEYAPSDEAIEADENLESRLTDYCIGRDVIYAAFAWSQAEEAYELVRNLAQKHGVGFFDASGDCDIIMPDGGKIE